RRHLLPVQEQPDRACSGVASALRDQRGIGAGIRALGIESGHERVAGGGGRRRRQANQCKAGEHGDKPAREAYVAAHREAKSGERGFSFLARCRLRRAAGIAPAFVSSRARTSHSRQSEGSFPIASAIALRAPPRSPVCSRTSASWRSGEAAQGWMRCASRAASRAATASPRATAAWLSRTLIWARNGIPWVTI